MTRRGLTLLELLISIAIIAIATAAVSRAYISGITFQDKLVRTAESRGAAVRFEDEIIRLIQGAETGGNTRYLVSPVPTSDAGIEQNPRGGRLRDGSASLALTTLAPTPPVRYLRETSADFGTLNDRYGPMGGVTEVALSTVPVGDAGRRRGLFVRQQSPADEEPARGGTERVLDEGIDDIRFEFYDGTDWLSTWDSREEQKDRLPLLIRVTYIRIDEPMPRTFVVRPVVDQSKAPAPFGPPATSGGNPPPGTGGNNGGSSVTGGNTTGGPPSGQPGGGRG